MQIGKTEAQGPVYSGLPEKKLPRRSPRGSKGTDWDAGHAWNFLQQKSGVFRHPGAAGLRRGY